MRLDELFIPRPMLLEKRRRADVNKKVGLLDALEKYRGQENVFVSFTSDVGVDSHYRIAANKADVHSKNIGIHAKGKDHNTRGAKLGVNPNSEYDTPIGIYSYPVDYVLQKEGKVPFAGDQPYAYVFRAGGNILNLKTYSAEDLKRDTARILDEAHGVDQPLYKGLYSSEPFDPSKATSRAKIGTAAGMFWNLTRVAAQFATAAEWAKQDRAPPFINYSGKFGEEEDHPDEQEDDDYYDEELDDDDIEPEDYYDPEDDDDYEAPEEDEDDETKESAGDDRTPLTEARRPAVFAAQWNALMRRLGYDGVVDDGAGIIHENEPTQAVFFSTSTIRPLEVLPNIAPRTDVDQIEIWRRSPKTLLAALRKGTADGHDVLKFLQKCTGYIGRTRELELPFELLPDNVKEWYRTHVVTMAYLMTGHELLDYVQGVTDEQIMEFLKKCPDKAWEVPADRITPEVQNYIINNAPEFFQNLGAIKLPIPAFIKIMRLHPELTGRIFSDPRRDLQFFKSDAMMRELAKNPQTFSDVMVYGTGRHHLDAVNPKIVYEFLSAASKIDFRILASGLDLAALRSPQAFERAVKAMPIDGLFQYWRANSYNNLIHKRCLEIRPELEHYKFDD